MVAQFNLPIEVISAPTIREASGLAMSSRNQKLSVSERDNAAGIYKALNLANSTPDLATARSQLTKGILAIPNFLLDYAEIIDGDNFSIANDSTSNSRAIIAGWINGIRLIDNMVMSNWSNLGNSK
jgi:pantoate--beta-alanine ligase